MESDAAVQEDLEHVIKVSLQAIDCELDDFENQGDAHSELSARHSNLDRKPRHQYEDSLSELDKSKDLGLAKQHSLDN
jgi:hypothetical protein